MHDVQLQQAFDQILAESQARVRRRLNPTGWTIDNRGNQDRWHGRSVIHLDTAPDEIIARPSTPKAVFITGS